MLMIGKILRPGLEPKTTLFGQMPNAFYLDRIFYPILQRFPADDRGPAAMIAGSGMPAAGAGL